MLSGVREFYEKYGPAVRRIVKNLEKIQTKLIKCRNQIKFLKECHKEDVIPVGFRIPNKWEESNRNMDCILKNAGWALVREQINVLYKKIKKFQATETGYLIDLYGALQNNDYRWLLDHMEKKTIASYLKDASRIDKKLVRLKIHKNNSYAYEEREAADSSRGDRWTGSNLNSVNLPRDAPLSVKEKNNFVNLTNKTFSEKEIALLNQGTNYAVKGKVHLMDTISQLDRLTKNKETVHKLVNVLDKRMEEVDKTKFQKNHLNDFNIIRSLKSDKEIKMTRADKGGKLVAMSADEYNIKMRAHMDTKYKKLEVDPTKKLVAQLRLFVTRELGWSSRLRDELAPLYPNTPTAYGQPKIHKEDNPLRVIISQKETCYSQIGKFVVKKLNLVLDKPASHIKNGDEFLSIITQRTIPMTSTLVSFDVVDMFTNISVDAALKALEMKLEGIDNDDFERTLLMTKTQCVKLVKLILNNNYFMYDNAVYKQDKGLAMGSPLSPLLSDLVMENLEIEIQKAYHDRIEFWCRFIDDTFAEWTGQRNELEPFLEFINTLDPSIKFTMEVEKENALTFLDTKITKMEEGVKTSVYRKPTAGDGIIPFDSCNPLSLKLSVARQKARRIENYHNVKTDEIIAKRDLRNDLLSNGYPINVIKKVLHSNEKEGTEKEERKFIPLQYDEKMEKGLKSIICNDKVGVAWKQNTKILDIYKRRGFPTKNREIKNVIYVIPCDCGNIYIGETGRPFKVRIKEHMANVRLKREQSKLYLHLDNNEGHVMLWDDAFLLESEINSRARKIKEGMLIELNKQICISDKTVEVQKEWEWVLQKYKMKKKYFGVEMFVV